ncbi:chain length determinant protein tyrosine kinase EpsG [Silvimonas sp. JCM 19000]
MKQEIIIHNQHQGLPTGNMGQLLLDQGKLTLQQAENVLRLQKEQNILFGEAAIKLGYVTERDIQSALSHQFSYSHLAGQDTDLDQALVAAHQPFGHEVEAIRGLRSKLMLKWITPGNKSLAITSCEETLKSHLLAANLAIVFSQLGERTLLIDANMRNPQQHALFKIDQRPGLSDILAGRANLSAARAVDGLRALHVLPAGTVPPNPQELLTRMHFDELMLQAISEFDVVIVDTPALDAAADGQLVAARARGVVMVAQTDITPVKSLNRARDEIVGSGAEVLGCVMA